MSEDDETAQGGGSPEPRTFAQVYARRPARPRRGMLPGRRVWVALGSAASVGAVAGLVLVLTQNSAEHHESTRTAAAAAGVPTPSASTPSVAPSSSADSGSAPATP